MHLRITREITGSGSSARELYYLREVPHVPGKTLQATGLTLEACLWTAGRCQGVTQIDQDKPSA